MDRHLNDLRSSPTLPGFDRIRTPGEDRLRRRADRAKNGVELPGKVVKQLDDMAASLKIAPLLASKL
jgi:LDH2 family malate/lactate/ureidoglycolate dehydrogenase